MFYDITFLKHFLASRIKVLLCMVKDRDPTGLLSPSVSLSYRRGVAAALSQPLRNPFLSGAGPLGTVFMYT
jgi:hypothetical protein